MLVGFILSLYFLIKKIMETNNYYSRDPEEHFSLEQKSKFQSFVDLMRNYVDFTEKLKNIPSFDLFNPSEKLISSLYLNDEARFSKNVVEAKRDFLFKYQELSIEKQMELDEYLLTIFPESELIFIKRAEYSH